MKITVEEVTHVANLARLNLNKELTDTFAAQIGTILDYVDTLNQVDTKGVPPTSHAISLKNAFRMDIQKDEFQREELLSNAPDQEDGFFVVPKVIE